MQYFDHDTGAATDPKIMQLRLECGGAAVDAYWYFIEQMHRDERSLCVGNANAMRVHCHTLCTDFQTLEKWVLAMIDAGLMKYDEMGDNIISERAESNYNAYKEKRQKASSAAKSRWDNADAKQPHKRTQCERNANAMPRKEKKRKSSSAIKSTTNSKASGAAVAEKTAPPAAEKDESKAPHCPLCDSLLRMVLVDGDVRWVCECVGAVKDESVVWK